MRSLITLVNDNNVNNYTKENLAFVYNGSIVNNRSQHGELEYNWISKLLWAVRFRNNCINRTIYTRAAFSSAVIVNVSPWIPVPNAERKYEQESRAKRSRVTCTSVRSPGRFSAIFDNGPVQRERGRRVH